MAETFATSQVPSTTLDVKKNVTPVVAVDEVRSSSSDISSDDALDSSIIQHGDMEVSLMAVKRSHFHQGRVISRTSRRSSRTYGHEGMARAETHFYTLTDFISNASREAANLKEFWSGLSEEYHECIKERDELYECAIKFDDERDGYIAEHKKHERIIHEKLRIIADLEVSWKEAVRSVTREKKRCTTIEESNKRLRDQLQEAGHRYNQLESERSSLQIELRTAESRIKIVERERDSSQKAYDSLFEEHREACNARDILQGQWDELEPKYSEARAEVLRLTSLLETSDSERLVLSERCDKLTVEVGIMKKELEQTTKEIIEWTNKYNDCKDDADRYLASIRKLESEKLHLSTEFRLINTECKELKEEQSMHLRIIDNYKRDTTSLQDRLAVSETNVRTGLQRNATLRDQLTESNNRRQELHDQLKVVSGHYSDAKIELSNLTEEVSEMKKYILTLEHERTDYKERAENAERDLFEWRSKAEQFEFDFKERHEQYTELHVRYEKVVEERRQLSIDLEAALDGSYTHDRHIKNLKDRVNTLEEENDNIFKHRQSLETQVEIIRKERDASFRDNELHTIRWDAKCRQVDRLLREGIYCPCEHTNDGGRFLPMPTPKPFPLPPSDDPKPAPAPKPQPKPVDGNVPGQPRTPILSKVPTKVGYYYVWYKQEFAGWFAVNRRRQASMTWKWGFKERKLAECTFTYRFFGRLSLLSADGAKSLDPVLEKDLKDYPVPDQTYTVPEAEFEDDPEIIDGSESTTSVPVGVSSVPTGEKSLQEQAAEADDDAEDVEEHDLHPHSHRHQKVDDEEFDFDHVPGSQFE